MSKKSKFFRVFTEGHTTDGRIVSRQWIQDIVATFNPKTYGARVWLEHMRGYLPDSPFKAYGDVTAVKHEEVDGKLTLFAQIEPTEDLIAMNKQKQKMYTSVEIDPDFARTGKCYLTGLAVTDSPASLGTDMLAFSAKADANPLASRKQKPENLFTAAVEFTLELEPDEPEPKPEASLFSKVSDLLGKFKKQQTTDITDMQNAVEAVATAFADAEQQFNNQLAANQQQTGQLQTELTQLKADFAQLKNQLEQEPEPSTPKFRAPATGGDNLEKTDC